MTLCYAAKENHSPTALVVYAVNQPKTHLEKGKFPGLPSPTVFGYRGRMRRKRIFHDLHKQALLTAIGECRRACIKAQSAAPINGDVYEGVSALMERIDDLAAILTGSREHFHVKPHSAPDH
jgi:hypothetical protein